MKPNLLAGIVAGLLAVVTLERPAPAQTKPTPDGKDGLMIVGTAGDMQGINNLIYVVHKRPPTEREAAFLKGIDPKFPEERITLSVYRMNQNGAETKGSPAGKLLFMRDITWDEMTLGSDPAIYEDSKRMKEEVNRLLDLAEKQKKGK